MDEGWGCKWRGSGEGGEVRVRVRGETCLSRWERMSRRGWQYWRGSPGLVDSVQYSVHSVQFSVYSLHSIHSTAYSVWFRVLEVTVEVRECGLAGQLYPDTPDCRHPSVQALSEKVADTPVYITPQCTDTQCTGPQ